MSEEKTTEKKFEIITLTFFKDWHELTKKYKLTKEQYGAVVHAMCEYSFYGEDTEMSDITTGLMFDMSKPFIKTSNERKIKGHKGGSKGAGGAPVGNKNRSKKKE